MLVGVTGCVAAGGCTVTASGDERIGHHPHELVHRIEGGLLRPGRGFAGDLRQGVGETGAGQSEQRVEARRHVGAGQQRIVDSGRDVLLVDIGVGGQVRRQQAGIDRQKDLVADITHPRIAGETVAGENARRVEGAVDGARDHDGVGGGCADARQRIDRDLAREVGDAGHNRHVARCARYLHQIGRCRRHRQAAADRQRADRIARRQCAAVDVGVADRADAAERAAGVDDDAACRGDIAVDRQRAAVHGGRAGVCVDSGQRHRAGTNLDE